MLHAWRKREMKWRNSKLKQERERERERQGATDILEIPPFSSRSHVVAREQPLRLPELTD
jgi:hypothetical protein